MPDFSPHLQSWLSALLKDAGAVAGTDHLHERGGLRLAPAANLPGRVPEVVGWGPAGRGRAGLALERGQPVQTCNLQEDRSGAVEAGAKALNAQAAAAMPVRDRAGAILAVVGVAFAEEREIQGQELERLQDTAATLAGVVGDSSR